MRRELLAKDSESLSDCKEVVGWWLLVHSFVASSAAFVVRPMIIMHLRFPFRPVISMVSPNEYSYSTRESLVVE